MMWGFFLFEAFGHYMVSSRARGVLGTYLYDMVETNLLICSVGGAYIAWIYPRHLYITYLRLFLGPMMTRILDLLSHQYPLYYVLAQYSSRRKIISGSWWWSPILSYAPPACYLLLHQGALLSYYSLRWFDLVVIVVVSILLRQWIRSS